MNETDYRAELARLKRDWGSLSVDPLRPGVLLAEAEPFTGLIVGMRAPIIAEIINRALAS